MTVAGLSREPLRDAYFNQPTISTCSNDLEAPSAVPPTRASISWRASAKVFIIITLTAILLLLRQRRPPMGWNISAGCSTELDRLQHVEQLTAEPTTKLPHSTSNSPVSQQRPMGLEFLAAYMLSAVLLLAYRALSTTTTHQNVPIGSAVGGMAALYLVQGSWVDGANAFAAVATMIPLGVAVGLVCSDFAMVFRGHCGSAGNRLSVRRIESSAYMRNLSLEKTDSG